LPAVWTAEKVLVRAWHCSCYPATWQPISLPLYLSNQKAKQETSCTKIHYYMSTSHLLKESLAKTK
jgi:hypothetical protein